MIFKKKFLLLTILFIIIFQTLIYTNNNQKTSFRYFTWTLKEVSIGELITISFFSGLFISTSLTTLVKSFERNTYNNIEENFEPLYNEDVIKSNIEMPPQRDIRDAQPTISVNYRVIKNNEEVNLKKDKNFSNRSDKKDDWDNEENDW